MRILYDSKKTEYKSPFGALKANEKCSLCIKIPKTSYATEVFVHFRNNNTGARLTFPLAEKSSQGDYDVFGGSFALEETGLYFYHFAIKTIESDFELFRYGYDDTNIGEGEFWQLTCYGEDFTVPKAFRGKVMYQIFPDRFFCEEISDAKGKLTPFRIHENKNDVPDYLPDESGEITNCDFYGGNLKGITAKLDYIKSLGVSVIYLNPIFMAYSNHRYDACDYKRIDPLLGTEEDFSHLCSEAHKRGIKIILDGVFSHTGSNSIYFDKEKIFGTGAYENPESPYRSWYDFGENDDCYDSWWGIRTLPCVNELDESYIDYIIRDSDSVIAHWMRLGADGWRLDVADELPDEFIRILRSRVKEINPESFVIGEVWEDASNKISYGVRRKYFTDSELDSVMNYVFKNAIIDFCTDKISGREFANQIMTIAENYPHEVLHSLMNSLSTHDTARIMTVLSEKGEGFSKKDMANFALEPCDRHKAVQRVYIAAFLQYMLPGTACIYYGDEIGMEGFGDPFNRGFFKWENQDTGILDFFRELGKIKNEYAPLGSGSISFDHSEEGVLKLVREYNGEKIVAFINKSDREYCHNSGKMIFGHNVSVRQEKVYIQKNGFAAFSIGI